MEFDENIVDVDKSGQLTLPLGVRENMGIENGTLVTVKYDKWSNSIIIKNAYGECRECGTKEGFVPYGDICFECVRDFIDDVINSQTRRKKFYGGDDEASEDENE